MPGDHRHRHGHRRFRGRRRSGRTGAGLRLQDRQEGRHVEDLHGRDREPVREPDRLRCAEGGRHRGRCGGRGAGRARPRRAAVERPRRRRLHAALRREDQGGRQLRRPRDRAGGGDAEPPALDRRRDRPDRCRSRTRARAVARSARRGHPHARPRAQGARQDGLEGPDAARHQAGDRRLSDQRTARRGDRRFAHQPARRCRSDLDLPECRPDARRRSARR